MKLTKSPVPKVPSLPRRIGQFVLNLLPVSFAYLLIELSSFLFLKPVQSSTLIFGVLWSFLLASLILILPRKAGRITFGISYYILCGWFLAQWAYYQIFGKLMWISTAFFAGEGSDYLGDIVDIISPWWWACGGILIVVGVVVIWKFGKPSFHLPGRLFYLIITGAAIIGLCVLPEVVFQRDKDVWGTRSDYGRSSSYRAAYETMFDAKKLFDFCGYYQLLLRDIWKNEIYPITPAYRSAQQEEKAEIDSYFSKRVPAEDNEMTGLYAGKNVVLVLMESMDDWMITPEDTPTLYNMMQEGINFTNMYTPGYGSTRTLNSEFCMNTGIFMPTSGNYLFDYVTNDWNQSIAAQLTDNGYSAEVFHYNDASFYSRGVFEPAMGYNTYNCYADYNNDKDALYDDCLLFDIPQLNSLFFREGQSFNTIITRSAHLSYKYNEVLSHYALKQYPQYRGMYASEEEDCARVKAKLVDDMFARLLSELSEKGLLENTVIIGMTDHYTYGYKNMAELYALSGVDDVLLLEKTPFFIWSSDCPEIEVTKIVNTSDVVPTLLNLLGIDSPYHYLGQDAFDPDYTGYAIFPDGSWISQGVVCKMENNKPTILENERNIELTEKHMVEMEKLCQEYIRISNLLLTSNYYED